MNCSRCQQPTDLSIEHDDYTEWICADCLDEKKAKRSKYNNVKVDADGYTFDSQLEYQRYLVLKDRAERGVIRDLEVHKWYTLLDKEVIRGSNERKYSHEVDFDYWDNVTHDHVVEDAKGYKTAIWALKRRLFVARYRTIVYRVITKKDVNK